MQTYNYANKFTFQLIVCLIMFLLHLLEKTLTYAAIWSICILHGSALTEFS